MKKLIIKRFKEIINGTIGEFTFLDGDYELLKGYTLEPAGEDTMISGLNRRIPQGNYSVDYCRTPRFNTSLPRLYNNDINQSRYILIHHGNYPHDTDGSIIIGDRYSDTGLFNSNITLQKLLRIANYENFEVVIINELRKDDILDGNWSY